MHQPFLQRHPQLVGWVQADYLVALSTEERFLGRDDLERWPWEERVELERAVFADGEEGYEVLAGFIAVAHAMIEACLAHNAILVLAFVQRWIDAAQQSDEAEHDWRRGWERQLVDNPTIAWELEHSRETLLKRAGLTAEQREVYRRALDGESVREIARALGVNRRTVREWVEEGTQRLRTLRADYRAAAS